MTHEEILQDAIQKVEKAAMDFRIAKTVLHDARLNLMAINDMDKRLSVAKNKIDDLLYPSIEWEGK